MSDAFGKNPRDDAATASIASGAIVRSARNRLQRAAEHDFAKHNIAWSLQARMGL